LIEQKGRDESRTCDGLGRDNWETADKVEKEKPHLRRYEIAGHLLKRASQLLGFGDWDIKG